MSRPVAPSRRIRVNHVITGLAQGGAEMMLWKLLSAMPEEAWDQRVISLRTLGVIGPWIQRLGVPVTAAGFGSGMARLGAPFRLKRLVRSNHPELVQGWMYHGNLAALAGRSGGVPVVWNIRQSLTDLGKERKLTALVIRAGARLSRRATAIVYNSRTSARQHHALGYHEAGATVIPNGFDVVRFRPDPEGGARIRAELGIDPRRVLVGQVARYHPMKNHLGLLRAAAQVVAQGRDAHFVLAGTGVDHSNPALTGAIAILGLAGRVSLLGAVERVPELMAGLDLLCSPSVWGEGFPNVLGEALAAGVPCVATDVGDSAWVVGEAGQIVPPGDDRALAQAVGSLIDCPPEYRRRLGELGRQRITREFALSAVAKRYTDLYRTVLAQAGPSSKG